MPADNPGRERGRRNPFVDGPRIIWRNGWAAADLTPWGGNRPTLRNPEDRGWPTRGERTRHEDVAKRWAWRYVDRLTKQTHDRQRGLTAKRPLGPAIEEFLRHRAATREAHTHESDVTATGHLEEAFGKRRDLHSIADGEIQKWLDDRAGTYAGATLETYRAHFRAFFNWAGRPLGKIILARRHKHDPDTLSDDEIAAVIEACRNERERALVAVGLATGARRAELWALEWPDFRADGISVRIQRQVAWPKSDAIKGLKGKRARTALVLPGFMDAIERKPSGRVMPGWVVNNRESNHVFCRVLQRAGCYRPGRSTHILRHTYSRLGLEKYEWSLMELGVFLGHTSTATTEVYKHFSEEVAIRRATERTYPKGLRLKRDG